MKAKLYKIFSVLAVFFFCLTTFTAGAATKNLTGGEELYLKPNTNWKSDNARFATYFFNNSTGKNTWVDMALVCDGVYMVVAPSGTWKNLIF